MSGTYEGWAAYGMVLLLATVVFTLGIVALLPALITAGLARRKADGIANRRAGTVIAQYDPPRGLTPAEIGLLYDMRCGKNELMGTLFDLEQRGVITVLSGDRVKISNKSAYNDLKEYEKIAIRIANGDTSQLEVPRQTAIRYSDPLSGEAAVYMLQLPSKNSMTAFRRAVQAAIESKHIRMNNYQGAFIARVLIIIVLLGLLPMLLIAVSGTSNGSAYDAWSVNAFITAIGATVVAGFFLFPVYIVAAIVLVWIWTKVAGRYWLNTKQARTLWPEIEGYKLYLKQVDLDNIQFESMTNNPVTHTFPYALVFGLETKWQQRLKLRST